MINGLYLGSLDSATDVSKQAENGITHILSVLNTVEDKALSAVCFGKGVTRKRLDVTDNVEGAGDMASILPEATKFLRRVLKNRKNTCLVHCWKGSSRSATVIMAYLIKYENLTFHEAYDQVKELRPIAEPNPAFVKVLQDWASITDTRKDKNRSCVIN